MIYGIKRFLKRLLPHQLLQSYHRLMAWLADVRFGHPSRQMIIIGITGTKGKSTTANILWHILTQAGHTVGLTGTVNYRIGNQTELTTNKMTMSGGFVLQRWLDRMVRAGCDIAIVETTSEGIVQSRHRQIWYDVAGMTNLFPEHIESHGGFENYKAAKLELFHHLRRRPAKVLQGRSIPQVAVINTADQHADAFVAASGKPLLTVSDQIDADVVITEVVEQRDKTICRLNGQPAQLPLLGQWNAYNAAMAVGMALAVGVPIEQSIAALPTTPAIPGRMEFIDQGQSFGVIVDYAYEPTSLRLLYEFARQFLQHGQRLITLISSTGGGRDVARRPQNGAVAAQLCDIVIVTDEDPYDDDPLEIMRAVTDGALQAGAVEGKTLWQVSDRKQAIAKAFSLARPGDIVLLTAKGAEQKICLAGGTYKPWDDRRVARQLLRAL